MARGKFASYRATVVDNVAGMVGSVVQSYRRRGLKAQHAREAAASHLGVSPRRVRAYLEGEVDRVPDDEAASILRGMAAAQAALEAEIAAERENIRRLHEKCEAVSALLSAAGGLEP